jgi:hypothetical protein
MNCHRGVCSKLALAGIFGLLFVVTALLAQSARTLALADEVQAYHQDWRGLWPLWSGHALVGTAPGSGPQVGIWTITKDGHREDIRFALPGASTIGLTDVSRRPDGALALIGGALSSDSQAANFLAWISPDRTRQTVVRLAPYYAGAVTFAPDGTIWVAGEIVARDYDILLHFDESGRRLGSAVPRSTVGGGAPALSSRLTASRDRIGWYTGFAAGIGQYIELTPNGELIDRFPGVPLPGHEWRARSVALSENNDVIVYLEGGGKEHGAQRMYTLDRLNRAWVPLELPTGQSYQAVVGFEGNAQGNTLVLRSLNRIRFYKLPGPATQH